MPRILAPPPPALVDASSGRLAFGSYRGGLPAVVLPRVGVIERALRRKRWVYVAIGSERVWIALAVVHTGYASTAFGFAYDLREKRMLADATFLGSPMAATVTHDPHGFGPLARFDSGPTSLAFDRGAEGLSIAARIGGLELDATLDDRSAPPAISAIADLGEGLVNATEKVALAEVRGRLRQGAAEYSLDGASGGYDYTYGLLPRHTKWRWAYGLGRARGGRPIAFNVVQGFVGEAECAAWDDRGVHPLGEATFAFDPQAPNEPWRVTGGGLDLEFTVGAVHAQHTNLGLVKSRFLQPVGTFRGTVRIGDEDVAVDALPGVVEDQDVLW